MSDNKDKIIKSALYTAILNKLTGELSELEAKEILTATAEKQFGNNSLNKI